MNRKKPSHRRLAADRDRRIRHLGLPEDGTQVGRRRPVATRAESCPHSELLSVGLPIDIDLTPIPAEIEREIELARTRIQAFQDRWDQPQIEQFVASDFELVYRVLRWIVERDLMIGRRMVEWGCGFAVVASLASTLGLDVTGIEAERRLLEEAESTVADFATPVDLVWGNFLPVGSEKLSPNPDFPSLGHRVPSAYRQMGDDLDDFALVFGYPWPGEWEFHEAVFAHYGAPGALLVLFCGPHDIRVWRKPTSLTSG